MEEGDLTLLSDTPEFSPCTDLPQNTHMIGPLFWHNDYPAPQCVQENKIDKTKPCIYFTIGSFGIIEFFDEIKILADQDIQIIAAMGKEVKATDLEPHPNIFLEEFVNTKRLYESGDDAKPVVDLLVCHGGNGTIYQALASGIPIVGIASHEEQFYGLKRVKHLGLGKAMHARELEKKGIKHLTNAITEVLENDHYKKNALAYKETLNLYSDSAKRGADHIESFIASSK